MDKSAEVLIGMAVVGLMAITAWVVYRWRQKKRASRVEKWVKKYLFVRYGELPDSLSISCSNDLLWPVLVTFSAPGSGIRRHLQFACGKTPSTLALLSDK